MQESSPAERTLRRLIDKDSTPVAANGTPRNSGETTLIIRRIT
jgi:hypothetical protein